MNFLPQETFNRQIFLLDELFTRQMLSNNQTFGGKVAELPYFFLILNSS